MKTLRQLCAALMLTLMVTLSTFAGEITTGVTAPLPESQAIFNGHMDTGITGEISTSLAGDMTTGVTSTLSLLRGLMPLF